MHNFASRIGPDYVLPACALLVLPVAVVAPLITTWLAIIAAVACLPHLRFGAFANHRARLWLAGAASLLVLWGALTAVWSVIPDHSLQTAAKLVGFTIGGAALLLGARQVSANGRDHIADAILIGLLVAIVAIGFEVLSDGALGEFTAGPSEHRLSPLSHLNRAAGLLAIFTWIAVAAMWHRLPIITITALVAISLGLLLFLDPSTPVLAFAFAGVIFMSGFRWPRASGAILVIVVFTAFLGAPFAETISDDVSTLLDSVALNESTIQHRLDIWAFVGERIMERPLTGWGLDASRAIPGGDSVIGTDTGEILNPFATLLPLHPHNATLQFWIELGLPGAFLASFIIAAAILAAARITSDVATRGALLAAIAAALVVGEMSFGIWQGWWLSTLWLLAAFVTATGDHEYISGG
jgi:exopolysaccharide production protein ExoQ